mgnify:CR=1 FL=1
MSNWLELPIEGLVTLHCLTFIVTPGQARRRVKQVSGYRTCSSVWQSGQRTDYDCEEVNVSLPSGGSNPATSIAV